VLAPAIYPKLLTIRSRIFTTIGRVGTSSIMLVATKDFAANDIKGLIALAKKGEPIQYGSWGVGSTGQFCAGISDAAGRHQDGPRALQRHRKLAGDLLGGHISLATLDMATATPLVKDGSIKALAACGERSPSLPDVASYKEQGVPFDRSLSWAMYAPAGLATRSRRKLSAALKDRARRCRGEGTSCLALGITPQSCRRGAARHQRARHRA
jgi:tripartite-type tricarboxylate transporter receptor subunit TctC